MKTSVAGLRTELPNQNAIAEPAVALRARRPTTTGAAQQVHIMVGTPSKPPAATLPKPCRPSTRPTQCTGTRAWTAEPSSRPSTMACQIALPYAHA